MHAEDTNPKKKTNKQLLVQINGQKYKKLKLDRTGIRTPATFVNGTLLVASEEHMLYLRPSP